MKISPVGARWTKLKSENGGWYDSNPFGTRYRLGNHMAVHNGADLNLPGNADRDKPVYAVSDGVVHFAKNVAQHIGRPSTWGNLIVLKHNGFWTRYGHLARMFVKEGEQVKCGQIIGTIGKSGMENVPNGEHLHFDVCVTNILESQPMHWAGDNRAEVMRHYVDPYKFLFEEPELVTMVVNTAPHNLNIRAEPSLSAPIVGRLAHGTQVRVYYAEGWSQLENKRGWVSSAYLSRPDEIRPPGKRVAVGVNIDPRNPVGNPAPEMVRPLRYIRFSYHTERSTVENAHQRYGGIISRFVEAGITPILVLNHETWGEGYFNWNAMTNEQWSSLIEGLTSVTRQIVGLYRRSVIYQIWNEGDAASEASVYIPPEQYGRLLVSMVGAIRSVETGATIISQGHVKGDPSYWSAVRNSNAAARTIADSLSAVCVHPYGVGGGVYGWNGTVGQVVINWRRVTNGVPIWFTEFGICNGNAANVPDSAAAAYITSFLAQCTAAQVPVALWYGWATGMHSCLGLVNQQQQKHPAMWEAITNAL